MNDEEFRELKELNEMAIKFSRRMFHDMSHMVYDLPDNNTHMSLSKEEWTERLDLWRAIVYPDNGLKNYRVKLVQDNDRLERMVEGYAILLSKNGIPDPYFMHPPEQGRIFENSR